MVPEGWSRVPINQAGEVVTGTTPPTAVDEYYGEGFPFVSPADLGQHRWIRRAEKSITAAGLAVSRALPAGASLFVCIGSTIGKIGQSATVLSTNQQINAVVPKAGTDADYLYYALDFRASDIARLAGNQAVPLINKSQFSGEMIPLPPLPEQQKIAEILSTWDRAIETTEALLANARTQKRALMQSLLTGTRRFPGFEDHPWREVRLGELGVFKKGKGISKGETSDEGRFQCILYGELYTTYNEVISSPVSRTDSDDGIVSEGGDVLIPASTTTSGIDLAIASCVTTGGVRLGGDINIFRRSTDSIDGRFLAYFLTHIRRRDMAQFAQGATIVHLKGSDLLDLSILVPSIEEQNQILDVVEMVEKNINDLEHQLDRLRTEKKSLMQQLLTGKRRVVV